MIFIVMTTTLMLTVLLSVNLMKVSARVNSSQYDMKSVTDNIISHFSTDKINQCDVCDIEHDKP